MLTTWKKLPSGITNILNRFSHDPDQDPGLGLFQRCDGQFDLEVVGENIVSVNRKLLHPLQGRYVMDSGYDEDFVICPTLKSIQTGNVPLPFRINHSECNPTHELVWIPHALDYPWSHHVLKGKRVITSRTEIRFNYNLKWWTCLWFSNNTCLYFLWTQCASQCDLWIL